MTKLPDDYFPEKLETAAPEGLGRSQELTNLLAQAGADAPPPLAYLQRSGARRGQLRLMGTVTWTLTPGVAPWRTRVKASRAEAEAWLAGTGRGQESRGSFADQISLHLDGREFTELRVERAEQVDPWTIEIHLADRRADWDYVILHGRFNLTRRSNDRYSLAGENSFADVNDDQRTWASYRYLPFSLKTTRSYDYRNQTIETEVGPPWTAAQLAREMLRRCFRELGTNPEAALRWPDDLPDNGVPIDMQQFAGQSAARVIAYCLARANLQITVDPNGRVRAFDPYDTDLQLPDVIEPKAGALRVVSLARERPKRVVWSLTQERELRCYAPAGPGDETTNAPYLRNVVRISYRFVDYTTGREYEPGTWVPVQVLYDFFGIGEDAIRLGIFVPQSLYATHCRIQTGNGGSLPGTGLPLQSTQVFDPQRVGLMQDLLRDWRSAWQLNPNLRDQLLGIRPVRVDVLNPTDRAQVPSPVFLTYYEEDLDIPFEAGVLARPARDPKRNRSSFDTATPSRAPATLSIEDQELGIMRINMSGSVDPFIRNRWPFQVENPGAATANHIARGRPITEYNLRANEAHRLEVILTVEPATPNDREAWHEISVNVGGDGQVPVMQRQYNGEPARFNVDGELINENLLNAILEVETNALMESLRDRPRGVLTIAHDPADDLRIWSHIRELRFVCRSDGIHEVVVNCSAPPPPPDAFQGMPPLVASYLQRQAIAGWRDGSYAALGASLGGGG